MRPLCKSCNQLPAAINGYHNNKIYYRKQCNVCIRKGKKLKKQIPRWHTAGYEKKKICDRCNFVSRYPAQLVVYHVNGNLTDCDLRNLRTVCLNCVVEITRADLPWKRGDLEEDR